MKEENSKRTKKEIIMANLTHLTIRSFIPVIKHRAHLLKKHNFKSPINYCLLTLQQRDNKTSTSRETMRLTHSWMSHVSSH